MKTELKVLESTLKRTRGRHRRLAIKFDRGAIDYFRTKNVAQRDTTLRPLSSYIYFHPVWVLVASFGS